MKILVTSLILTIGLCVAAQNGDSPALVNLKTGKTIDVKHFGPLKCGSKSMLMDNYIIIRGKYMDIMTEITKYHDVEKIVPVDFKADPVTSVGNEKAIIRIYKKNGVAVSLEEAEFALSCYGPEDKYNTIVVQILNPLTNKVNEMTINVNEISSIIFK